MKKLCIILCVVLVATLLSSCGEKPDTSVTTAELTEPVSSLPPEQVTVKADDATCQKLAKAAADLISDNEEDFEFDWITGYTFIDLDLDGVPEFIVNEQGGSMLNSPASVFYFDGTKFRRAAKEAEEGDITGGFDFQSMRLYSNQKTGEKAYYCTSYNRFGWSSHASFLDKITYANGNLKSDTVFSRYSEIRDEQNISDSLYEEIVSNDESDYWNVTYTYRNSEVTKNVFDEKYVAFMSEMYDLGLKYGFIRQSEENLDKLEYSELTNRLLASCRAFSYNEPPAKDSAQETVINAFSRLIAGEQNGESAGLRWVICDIDRNDYPELLFIQAGNNATPVYTWKNGMAVKLGDISAESMHWIYGENTQFLALRNTVGQTEELTLLSISGGKLVKDVYLKNAGGFSHNGKSIAQSEYDAFYNENYADKSPVETNSAFSGDELTAALRRFLETNYTSVNNYEL